MNLKSKMLGTVAAAAITLSMTFGVASADPSASSSASAELIGGACSIVANSSANFGNWVYDGNEYLPENGVPEVTLNWTLTEGNPSGCNVNINFYGIQNGSSLIGLNAFYTSVHFGDSSQHVGPTWGNAVFGPGLGYVASGVPTGGGSMWLQLNGVPGDLMPGTYNGAVYATVQNTL
jgi:hypothetical protein